MARELVLGFPIYVECHVGDGNEKTVCVRFDANTLSMDFYNKPA